MLLFFRVTIITIQLGVRGCGPGFRRTPNSDIWPIPRLSRGARGVLWWTSSRCTNPNYTANVLDPLSREISILVDSICCDSTDVIVTCSNTGTTNGLKNINYLYGKDGVYHYVIAVNNTNSTINNAKLYLDSFYDYNQTINVVNEGRTLSHTHENPNLWTITSTFSPYAVHIYRMFNAPKKVLEGSGYIWDSACGSGYTGNFPSDTSWNIREYWNPGSYDKRGFMMVDLFAIPVGSTISDSRLWMYYTGNSLSSNTNKTVNLFKAGNYFTTSFNAMTYDGSNAWTAGDLDGVDGYYQTPANRLVASQTFNQTKANAYYSWWNNSL